MSIRKTATRHPQLRSRLGSPAAARRAVIGSELKPVLRDGDEILIKFLPYREIVMTGRRISSR